MEMRMKICAIFIGLLQIVFCGFAAKANVTADDNGNRPSIQESYSDFKHLPLSADVLKTYGFYQLGDSENWMYVNQTVFLYSDVNIHSSRSDYKFSPRYFMMTLPTKPDLFTCCFGNLYCILQDGTYLAVEKSDAEDGVYQQMSNKDFIDYLDRIFVRDNFGFDMLQINDMNESTIALNDYLDKVSELMLKDNTTINFSLTKQGWKITVGYMPKSLLEKYLKSANSLETLEAK